MATYPDQGVALLHPFPTRRIQATQPVRLGRLWQRSWQQGRRGWERGSWELKRELKRELKQELARPLRGPCQRRGAARCFVRPACRAAQDVNVKVSATSRTVVASAVSGSEKLFASYPGNKRTCWCHDGVSRGE